MRFSQHSLPGNLNFPAIQRGLRALEWYKKKNVLSNQFSKAHHYQNSLAAYKIIISPHFLIIVDTSFRQGHEKEFL